MSSNPPELASAYLPFRQFSPWFVSSISTITDRKYSRGLLLSFLVIVTLVVYSISLPWFLGTTKAPEFVIDSASTGQFDVSYANKGWDFVGRFNGVDTFVRRADSSSPVLSFRGVAVLDVHISDCLGPFVNVTHSLEWISMLKSIEQWPHPTSSDPNVDVIYQVLNLPWPLAARDILLERRFSFQQALGQVTVSYRSTAHPQLPERPLFIRAHSPHTMWRFTVVSEDEEGAEKRDAAPVGVLPKKHMQLLGLLQKSLGKLRRGWSWLMRSVFRIQPSDGIKALPAAPQPSCGKRISSSSRRGHKTLVEVESTVDSKGSIPVWFLNYMQRFWPASTLRTFEKMAQKGLIKPDQRVLCW
eukprot:gene32575-39387_t